MMKTFYTFTSLCVFSQLFINVHSQVTYVNKGCARVDNPNDTAVGITRSINLIALIVSFSAEVSIVKFSNVTVGSSPYYLYGLYQCREDLSLDNCNRCVGDAMDTITQVCDYSFAEVILWYQECMLRYSDRPIASIYESSPSYVDYNTSSIVSKDSQFSQLLASSMDNLINFTASSTPSHIGASENTLSNNENLYCFAQCTPDINFTGCNACLRKALSQVKNCCSERIGVMIFLPSCQLRYDNKSFWMANMPLAPSLTMDQALIPTSRKMSPSKVIIIAAVASATLIGLAILIICLWLYKYNKQRRQSTNKIQLGASKESPSGNMDDKSLESLKFDFKRIKAATSNFSDDNKLGQGGFGEVYKGKLSNGEVIAVKRLSKNSEQGISEFQNEVVLVAKLQHRNLVKLLGFCLSGKEQILIYEYLINSSLDRFLYDPQKRASLEWEARFKIIIGVARGLLYLHEDSRLKIIHRDLKCSNILLDETMNPKIADFGLARLFDFDQTRGNTRRIAGTYGYMAPEYAMAGQFSVKSDVYSFGVIVLEIVSGQRHGFFDTQQEGLLHHAWRLWNEETILKFLDPLLGKNYSEPEVNLCILIALLCIQEDPNQRPRMASVVAALNGQSITLPLPSAPHFFTIGVVNEASTSGNNDAPLKDEIQETTIYDRERIHSETLSSTELCR